MASERSLTRFQEVCEAALADALRSVGRRLVERSLEGEKETYIKARVSDAKVWVYIYEDEAGIEGQGTFEAPAHRSEADLQSAFIQSVLKKITADAI